MCSCSYTFAEDSWIFFLCFNTFGVLHAEWNVVTLFFPVCCTNTSLIPVWKFRTACSVARIWKFSKCKRLFPLQLSVFSQASHYGCIILEDVGLCIYSHGFFTESSVQHHIASNTFLHFFDLIGWTKESMPYHTHILIWWVVAVMTCIS